MTFHPIERPTEPGWYWYSDEDDDFVVFSVDFGLNDDESVLFAWDDGYTIDLKRLAKFGQWYGPAIEKPNVAGKPSSFDNGTYH